MFVHVKRNKKIIEIEYIYRNIVCSSYTNKDKLTSVWMFNIKILHLQYNGFNEIITENRGKSNDFLFYKLAQSHST